MKILPISYNDKRMTNFKANLCVDKSVIKIIEPNGCAFLDAACKFKNWLQTEKKDVLSTMTIRKNTALPRKIAFTRMEEVTTYAYPHEDTGYRYKTAVNKYEDLEFELDNKKCGFWFDKDSNAEKLFSDFKNMFNFLHSGK